MCIRDSLYIATPFRMMPTMFAVELRSVVPPDSNIMGYAGMDALEGFSCSTQNGVEQWWQMDTNGGKAVAKSGGKTVTTGGTKKKRVKKRWRMAGTRLAYGGKMGCEAVAKCWSTTVAKRWQA